MIKLFGFGWDAGSSYARGAAMGPAVIRANLFNEASSPYSLSGVDVRKSITAFDFDDLPFSGEAARQAISSRIARALEGGAKPLSLGGDHSVTFPILRALRDSYGPLNILHVDAHTDLYESFNGDPFSHASPFYRAMEEGCIGALVQVGLRSVSPDARRYGEEKGVVMLGAEEIDAVPFDRLVAPLYVSLDLDGIDPAFAPGVSHPEPGGLSSREVIGLVGKLKGPLVGADIVELNPERDVNYLTAHLAARLVKELCAKLVE